MTPPVAHPAVSGGTAVLATTNAVLFVLGALANAGVAVGPIAAPVTIPATMIEVVCAIVLMAASSGVFTEAIWARRLMGIAGVLALAATVVVATLALSRNEPATVAYHMLLAARAVLALCGLMFLFRRP